MIRNLLISTLNRAMRPLGVEVHPVGAVAEMVRDFEALCDDYASAMLRAKAAEDRLQQFDVQRTRGGLC